MALKNYIKRWRTRIEFKRKGGTTTLMLSGIDGMEKCLPYKVKMAHKRYFPTIVLENVKNTQNGKIEYFTKLKPPKLFTFAGQFC